MEEFSAGELNGEFGDTQDKNDYLENRVRTIPRKQPNIQ